MNHNSSTQHRILLAEPIAQSPLDWISKRAHIISTNLSSTSTLPAHTLKELIVDAHALIVRTYTIVDEQLLDLAPQLRVVARAGVGLDNIDLQACKSRNIQVVHTPQANANAVIEYVTQMMLRSLRTIHTFDHHTHTDWHNARQQAISSRTIDGLTLGIIGLGQIGTKLAHVGQALGMNIIYHDLYSDSNSTDQRWTKVPLNELAQSSDIVSVHIDGRSSNEQYLSAPFFNQLKPNAIFINSSRGFVLNDHDASTFAQSNPDSTLILDVHHPEPIPKTNPYLDLPNVILTPHIASGTKQAKENMSWVVRDVIKVLENQQPEFPAFKLPNN